MATQDGQVFSAYCNVCGGHVSYFTESALDEAMWEHELTHLVDQSPEPTAQDEMQRALEAGATRRLC